MALEDGGATKNVVSVDNMATRASGESSVFTETTENLTEMDLVMFS